jgi:hypothetical protein
MLVLMFDRIGGRTSISGTSDSLSNIRNGPLADLESVGRLTAGLCQSTKSLCDSGGMWLVRSVFPTVEIVGNRCCLEDRGLSTLSEHAARRPMGQRIRSVTTVEDFGTANIRI